MRRHTQSRKQRYKKKILILRLEEILLLLVILVLMCGKQRSAAKESDGIWRTVIADMADGLTEEAEDTSDTVQEEYEWLWAHRELFPENKVSAAKDNPGLIHFLYRYGTQTYESASEQFLTEEELEQGIPLLLQWDDRWGYEAYGENNIGISGCGPTCLAMIVAGLTQNERITPEAVAAYAIENDYYMYGAGTKWDLFGAYAAEHGIRCGNLGKDTEMILSELYAGHPVICSMSPGIFTVGGHFIVLKGTENGRIIINDPNNVELSSREWKMDEFADQIKNAWSFQTL